MCLCASCPLRLSLLPVAFTAAQESVSAYRQDWGSIQSEFIKRFDTQLKQELSDHGSSITGAASTVRQCLVANQCVLCVLQFAVVKVPQVPCGAQKNWNHKLVQGLYRAVGEKLQLQLQHCCTVPCTSPLSRLSPPPVAGLRVLQSLNKGSCWSYTWAPAPLPSTTCPSCLGVIATRAMHYPPLHNLVCLATFCICLSMPPGAFLQSRNRSSYCS